MKRLQQGVTGKPEGMSDAMFNWSVTNLSKHGLISVIFLYDSYKIFEWKLTLKGEAYLESNPKLYNPINWDKWFAISCIISSALLAIIIYLRLTI